MFYFKKLRKEKERQRASIFWFILSDGYSSQSWVGSKLGASSRCLTKLQGPKHLSHALLLPQAIGGIGNGAARDSNGCLYDMPVLQADQSPKPLCQLLSQFVDRKSKQHGTSSGEELLVVQAHISTVTCQDRKPGSGRRTTLILPSATFPDPLGPTSQRFNHLPHHLGAKSQSAIARPWLEES